MNQGHLGRMCYLQSVMILQLSGWILDCHEMKRMAAKFTFFNYYIRLLTFKYLCLATNLHNTLANGSKITHY